MAEHSTDTFKLVLENTLENPVDSNRSSQSIPKEINPEYSLEGRMLKLELQYFLLGVLLVCECAKSLQLCPTLCNPMDCSTPGFPGLLCIPEFAQTHVSDAIQPSHPLSPPSPAFSLSQHQGLFQ